MPASHAQSLRDRTEQKLHSYFSKDKAVKDHVAFTEDSLFIFSTSIAHTKPVIALSWKQVEYLSSGIDSLTTTGLKSMLDSMRASHSKRTDSLMAISTKTTKRPIGNVEDMPLAGMRVAIDPGHIGGTYAMGEAESRCMTLKCDSSGKCDTIRLIEGNLTWFTALLLKKKLELKGAKVMLTRKDTGLSSLGITFAQWKKKIKHSSYVDSLVKANILPSKDVRLLRLRMKDKLLFERVFGSVDMAERAKLMNDFHPDISVSIHYNVNETNTGWDHPTQKDFVMAFVGGCVTGKDLDTEPGRLNFLRLLISPDIENSISFGSKVVQHLSADLGISIAHKQDATYLTKNCLSTTAEGVYSRDLALTRLTRGTVILGEALYQDNEKECRLLTANDGKFAGFIYPKRIETVANAYYEGIVEYAGGLR